MLRRSLTATAAVVAVITLVPQAAYAATPLANNAVVMTSTPKQYTFSTTTPYWSVVAINTAADYDLRLADGAGASLGSSTYGTGFTDFIAIDSNRRPLGAYLATVSLFSGGGPYWVQQRQGNFVVPLPTPANDGVNGAGDPDLGFSTVNSADVIRVGDIWLNAGEAFWAKVPNTNTGFFFLESNPAQPATFIRSRAQAASVPGTRTAQGCTLYTANFTGWHGLVALTIGRPEVTDPASGNGYALHRYDPARPNTCPQRNFPGNTPPGP